MRWPVPGSVMRPWNWPSQVAAALVTCAGSSGTASRGLEMAQAAPGRKNSATSTGHEHIHPSRGRLAVIDEP